MSASPQRGPRSERLYSSLPLLQPVLLDLVDGLQFLRHDFLWKLRIGQVFRIALAIGQRPFEEALNGVALGGIGELLGNQKPGKAGDGISGLAGGVDDGNAEVIRHFLGLTGSGRANGREGSLYEYARSVLHIAIRDFIGFGVDQFDVTDGVRRILDRASYAFVAFAAEAHGPVDGRAVADLGLPLVAELRKIVGPDVGSAAAVRAMHDDDVVCGKIYALVDAGDGRVLPLGYFAEENAGKGARGKIQSRVDTGNVVGGNGGAEHRGKVQDAESVFILESLELIVVHGAIGTTEIHGAFGDLLNAAAGANRLIVDLKIGVLLVVLVKPLRIHGVRKSGTRTVDRERAIRPQNAGDGENYQEQSCKSLHSPSPSESIVFSPGM